jgi:4-hydroxythreonine-4-phosphate dehydrogenase
LRDCPEEVTVLERLVVADDLSGAAESAATFLLRTTRIRVHLADQSSSTQATELVAARVVVLDSDTRHSSPAAAADTVGRYAAQLLGASARGTRVVKKVDSLLRGNLGPEVDALSSLLDATPVIATALPSAGRTVVGGVPLVDGRALAVTGLWDAETDRAPGTVADVLVALDHATIALDVVRDPSGLRAALAAAEARGVAAVCDAETDADLDAVVAAATVLRNPLRVGSAALVAADARQLTPDRAQPADVPARQTSSSDHVVVAVVGSAAPGVAEQVGRLADLGIRVLRLDPARLLASPQEAAREVARAIGPRGLVLALDQSATADLDPAVARRLTAALAVAAAPATERATVLLVTGGETARAVLGTLGVRTLTPLSTHAAAVTSRTADGLVVITRAGSHGASATSLRDALAPFATTSRPDPSATDLH